MTSMLERNPFQSLECVANEPASLCDPHTIPKVELHTCAQLFLTSQEKRKHRPSDRVSETAKFQGRM